MNAIEVEIHRHLFQSIAEEMGVVLRNTAFSPNIKERLDFSCAVTDREGAMVAQAAHIPVHLGSCHLTARHVLAAVELEPGDVVMLNDPFRGGTHLPDVTLFEPVFVDGEAAFGVLTRAHHADVGGGVPGSMGNFDELFKEGLIVPPIKIVARGRPVRDVLALFLANVRTPIEREGDLAAQIAATNRGRQRMEELVQRYGVDVLAEAGVALQERAARAMAAVIAGIPDGSYAFTDTLDGPGTPVIAVTAIVAGDRLTVDFTGSGPVVPAALNSHEAITISAVFYCVRCLADEAIPTNSGVLRPVRVVIPEDTIVGARHPAAVAGGNVETSQRIVDVVFGALARALPDRIPAASQGSMNNLSLGGRRGDGSPYTYFETIAGGVGASAGGPGASGLHSHMTNTLNTPIEVLELEYPVRVRAYHLRAGSGGVGRHAGGDGVVREVEALAPLTVTVLTTRRAEGPWGLAGGGRGKAGRNSLMRGGRRKTLPASVTLRLEAGDRIRLETPGGGAWGRAKKETTR